MSVWSGMGELTVIGNTGGQKKRTTTWHTECRAAEQLRHLFLEEQM